MNPEYKVALEAFRNESKKFRQAWEEYRARTIGDQEFLDARRRFNQAVANMDAAESVA